MGDAILLKGVNVLPSPTWNYLRINDIEIEVPTPPAKESVNGLEDGCQKADEGGMGPEASAWLRDFAQVRETVQVPARTTGGITEVLVDADANQVADHEVKLGAYSDSDVCVVISDAVGDVPAQPGSDPEGPRVCGSRLRIDAAEGAHAHVHVYVSANGASTCLQDTVVTLDDQARVELSYYLLGAGVSAVGLRSEGVGMGSAVAVDVHYLARDAQNLDMNYVMRLRGRKSKADLNAYGVLFDKAQKTLRDTIDLVRGGRGAEGHENETVLLAGADVVNKTLPVVLCDEDDVVGTHGATIGSISPEQLAYLRSRGLDEESAEALFARSVLDAAIAHAPTDASRKAALTMARQFLGADVATEIMGALGRDAQCSVGCAAVDALIEHDGLREDATENDLCAQPGGEA